MKSNQGEGIVLELLDYFSVASAVAVAVAVCFYFGICFNAVQYDLLKILRFNRTDWASESTVHFVRRSSFGRILILTCSSSVDSDATRYTPYWQIEPPSRMYVM
jgi:hypothetical protein